MPATTRHQRDKKALHLFDLPRETLLLILQREDVTATDLARFSCVSKGEKAREIAMEAAKNRVKSAWPESELNYKTEEDRERPPRRRFIYDDFYCPLPASRWEAAWEAASWEVAGEKDEGVDDENDDKHGKKKKRKKEKEETWLDAMRFLDGKIAEKREREIRLAHMRKKGWLSADGNGDWDTPLRRRKEVNSGAIQGRKFRMNWDTTTCTYRDGRTEIWGTDWLCDEHKIGSTKMKSRANEVFIGEDRVLYFKRFRSSALQSKRIKMFEGKRGKLIAPDFHWCAKQARKVLWVAIGTNHAVMLMESGEVYTFGKNRHGELGFANTVVEEEVFDVNDEMNNDDMMVDGNDTKPTRTMKIRRRTTFEYRTPRLLPFIREEGEQNDSSKGISAHPDGPDYISRRCRFVSAKKHTSMVTTMDGLVFGFGKNDRGQLGIGNNIMQYQPRKITTFPRVCVGTGQMGVGTVQTEDMKIKKAVCCGDHSVALSTCGVVYAFGSNQNFCCGADFPAQTLLQLMKDQWYPRRIALTWCDNPPRNYQGGIHVCEKQWLHENGKGTVFKDITSGWNEHDRFEIDENGDHDEFGVDNLEWSQGFESLIEERAREIERIENTRRREIARIRNRTIVDAENEDDNMDLEIHGNDDDERIYSVHAKDISGGDTHTVILDSSGIVWTVGMNTNGACGRIIPIRVSQNNTVMDAPALVNFVAKPVVMPTYTDEETGEERVVRMAEIHSGRFHLGAVAEKTGFFYGWGSVQHRALGDARYGQKAMFKLEKISGAL